MFYLLFENHQFIIFPALPLMEEKTENKKKLEPSSSTEESDVTVKQLTIIGRGECGKTSIISRFLRDEFKEEISATPIECENFDFEVREKKYRLKIWDTSGQDDYSRFRTLTLPMSDYVLICYSITDPMSFYEVESTLLQMVKVKGKEDAKVLLVATKKDMRTDDNISKEEGIIMGKKIGALEFIECSSLTGEGIKEIFSWFQNDMLDSFPPKKTGFLSNLFFCCC